VSLLLFVAGVFRLVSIAADSLKTTQRPAVAATVVPLSSPTGFASLEATVTASGMSIDERYLVQADLIDDPQASPDKQKTKEIFFAYAGPKLMARSSTSLR
jgi:hypothetical protein